MVLKATSAPRGDQRTRLEVAAQLGIDSAKASNPLAGQMAIFSVERLVHFPSLPGQEVGALVLKAPRGRRHGPRRERCFDES
jgi:hypothetical protein